MWAEVGPLIKLIGISEVDGVKGDVRKVLGL